LHLSNLGIDVDRDFDLVFYTNFDQNTRAVLHGHTQALSLEAGVPATAIILVKTFAGAEVVILDFTDAQLERADGGLGLWTRYVIQAGTYSHQDQDINTIATPTILAVRADVDADAVYQITKTIFENLEFLRVMYKTFLETSLDSALVSLPMPLHPGASRYYREVGLAIPADLISEKYLESSRDRKQP
jgi:TRAP transporter TAXI family solute receptor